MKQVYLLSDPITGQPMYIGSTKLKMSYRLHHHVNNKVNNKEKQEWLQTLQAKGLSAEVSILEDYCEDYELFEAMYIQLFKSWGFKLLNKSIDGRIGYFRTKEQNKKMSSVLMGRGISQNTRDAVGRSNKEILRHTTPVLHLGTGIYYDTILAAAKAHDFNKGILNWGLKHKSNPYKGVLKLDAPEF